MAAGLGREASPGAELVGGFAEGLGPESRRADGAHERLLALVRPDDAALRGDESVGVELAAAAEMAESESSDAGVVVVDDERRLPPRRKRMRLLEGDAAHDGERDGCVDERGDEVATVGVGDDDAVRLPSALELAQRLVRKGRMVLDDPHLPVVPVVQEAEDAREEVTLRRMRERDADDDILCF